MSETPRTDRRRANHCDEVNGSMLIEDYADLAAHSEDLERELARTRQAAERLAEALSAYEHFESEIERLNPEDPLYQQTVTHLHEHAISLRKEALANWEEVKGE